MHRLLNLQEIFLKEICGIPVGIFIHSTKRGPALGGTRALNYSNFEDFFRDGLKLSSAMTFKAIWARLPLGGGKAVIYAKNKKEILNREFARKYGNFLNEINHSKIKFITSEDIGCGEEFVDMVSQFTPFITGKSDFKGGLGDPSPQTVRGVFLALKAIFDKTLKGKICNVQGAGKTALPLMRMLMEEGAWVYFSEKDGDPIAENRAQKAEKIGAFRIFENKIYDKPCHIFLPCAIGGTMNKSTIPRLNLFSHPRVVIGAANNILETPEDGLELHKRGIFFAPDYIVNRWGLEWVTQERNGIIDKSIAENNLSDIVADILNLIKVSREKNIAPSELADAISQKILNDEVKSIEEAFENF